MRLPGPLAMGISSCTELASIVSMERGRGKPIPRFLEKAQSLPNIVEQILKKAKAITQIGDGFWKNDAGRRLSRHYSV
jgi:hypothetical protein